MSRFTIERARVIDAPAEVVWAEVADAGGYHRMVGSLEHTELRSDRGPGMVRYCRDVKGREWLERCTTWDEGRRYTMTVDTDTYPASLRAIIRSLAGTWSVREVSRGTEVTMCFTGETKLGPLGRMAIAALGRHAILDAILDAYERRIADRVGRHN